MTTLAADTIGSVAEDKFLLRLPEGLKPRLERLSKLQDRSLNAQIVRIMREWADEQERAEDGETKP